MKSKAIRTGPALPRLRLFLGPSFCSIHGSNILRWLHQLCRCFVTFAVAGHHIPRCPAGLVHLNNTGGIVKKMISRWMVMGVMATSLTAFAQSGSTMPQDNMKHDDMKQDPMKHDGMKQDPMKKDKKSKKTSKAKKDEMKNDSMKHDDGMKQN
jgi:pentapeptide MXKDX repeat protein